MSEAIWETRTIVGLEIHLQLRTETKMFCGCPVKYDAPPNSCVCPVCLGHPGALPVINRRAFEQALLTGLALNCTIARRTKWDRKSYYYPDLPKNYQISQYDLPFAHDGYIDIEVNDGPRRIRLQRAHLEEDAGKNLHDSPGGTLVDLNRAGTPLLEIVTEPDLTSADEAFVFCTELQRLVRHLGVSDGVMQRGQMRFEPNINVAIECAGREFRTPITEVKNLNSFRAVRHAIAYEAERQVKAWQTDHDYQFGVRPHESRGWNDTRGITEFQREKEAAPDYRYFPEPDLVPVEVTEAMLAKARASVPELPLARRRRLVSDLGLSLPDAETIVNHRPTADLFEAVVAAGAPPAVAGKQFVNVWLKLAHDCHGQVADLGMNPARMAELARITADGTVSKTAANRLAEVMLSRPEPPARLAEEMELVQVRDAGATEGWVNEALATHEQAVRSALSDPKKAPAAVGFLRGQVMQISGGKADPKLAGELIEEKLSQMLPDG